MLPAEQLRAASEVQVGFHLKKGALPRLVSAGLDDIEQVGQAKRVQHLPFDEPAPLALSARFAVDGSVALGRSVKLSDGE